MALRDRARKLRSVLTRPHMPKVVWLRALIRMPTNQFDSHHPAGARLAPALPEVNSIDLLVLWILVRQAAPIPI